MWQKIKELDEQRAEMVTRATSILAKAEKEKRDLTPEEGVAFDEIEKTAKELQARSERLKRGQSMDSGLQQQQFIPRDPIPGPSSRDAAKAGTPGLPGIARDQRMADFVKGGKSENGERLSIGKIIRGLATGEWSGADSELRAMSHTASYGGVMVPLPVSAEIIDLARAKSVVMQAGARTIPMTSSTLKVPRVVTDPSIGWKAENADFASSDATFEAVTLTAKTLGGIVRTSVELYEDVSELDNVVVGLLSSAIAVELDRAALRGDGTGDGPTGIRSTAGIQTIPAWGAVNNYTPFVRGAIKVLTANGSPNAIVTSPAVAGYLAELTDANSQPQRQPQILDPLFFGTSSNVPADLGVADDESEAYVGDFSQLWIGMRTQIMIEASRLEGTAFGKGQVALRAYLRGDCMVARPYHFCLISGLQATE